jgi:integrase
MKTKLTDVQARNAKSGDKPRKLTDGGGLYLDIRPTGKKVWRYRYRLEGKENIFTLGEYPCVGLEAARGELREARALVKQGVHPIRDREVKERKRKAEARSTFEAVAKEWADQKRANWSPYYAKQFDSHMGRDVFPVIGAIPIREVTADQLLSLLREVYGRGAETVALLERQWCSAIFRYAVATLRADYDPAAALKGAFTRPKVRHKQPLGRDEIAPLLASLQAYGGYRTTVIALELLLLTFVRPGELRAAEWSEFELEAEQPIWRIPAERMKMREPHLVPLSSQAALLLKELATLTGGQRWLFPNLRRPRTCMTITTLNRALERMGYGGRFSAHGFRATASTLLNEMGWRSDVIERQLAHQERNTVRRSYNQAEYLSERREMMQAWADCVDGLRTGGEVVPIKRPAAGA